MGEQKSDEPRTAPVVWFWTYDVTGEGPFCEGCGERFYPDCDVSLVSTAEEFVRHMAERHNLHPIGSTGEASDG